ncbi:MAG: hypothetical protein J7513_17765 [Solirubrobacteraceae bacterium]|nr:hypothetical protein [Solirubrobacteraceae bacterium]
MAVPRLTARRPALVRPVLLLAAVGAAIGTAPGAASAASGTVAGTVRGPLPKPGSGDASVRAYAVNTGRLVGVANVSPTGRFSLRLPAGGYLLHATSVRDRGARSDRLVAVSLRSKQVRRGLRITLQRVEPAALDPVEATPAAPAAAALPATTRIAYRLDEFTGDSQARATLGSGLTALVADDLRGAESCSTVQVAGDDVLPTLRSASALRRSSSFDGSTKIRRKLTAPRLVVQGALAGGPTAATSAATVRIVEPATGHVVDTLTGVIRTRGKGMFTDERRIAATLAERICQRPRRYRVALNLKVRGEYAAYNSTAAIAGSATAKVTDASPYALWKGSSPFTYTDNVFRSRVSGCPASAIYPGSGSWGARITVASSAAVQLQLDLGTADATAYSTADFSCPQDILVVTKAPGPLLVGLKPRTFTFPSAGGTATVDSAIRFPIPGFLHTGTLTLTPLWSHSLPQG